MTDLARWKKSRSANRNALSGLIVKAKTAMENSSVDVVETKLMLVNNKWKLIEELNRKIEDALPDEEISDEIDEVTQFEETVTGDMMTLDKFVKAAEKTEANTRTERRSRPAGIHEELDSKSKLKMDVALPKIIIKDFSGDPTEWQQFRDIFEATVDKQEKLSPVQKFMYLVGHLKEATEKCVEGIPVLMKTIWLPYSY